MLPRLADITPTQSKYLDFIDALRAGGFKGDLKPDYANRIAIGNRTTQALMREAIGLIDSPKLSGIDLNAGLQRRGIAWATPATLKALPAAQREKAVIVVQDAFTSYFESQLVLDSLDLLQRLRFVPLVAPFMANGKPLQVRGFLKAFQRTAEKKAAFLRKLAAYDVPLIGIDPSMTLTYRFEYAKALGKDKAPKVQLIQEWLAGQKTYLQSVRPGPKDGAYKLLAHCTERTNAAPSIRDWQSVFAAFGQSLAPVNVGCCGMAGTYGHEAANLATSRRIYSLSWSEVVNDPGVRDRLVVTGYSCRSQVKRIDGHLLQHPVQALLASMPS